MRVTAGDQTIVTVNTTRLRSLLAYLVLHEGAPQSREYLAFLLWPDSDESQARTNLRQLLHHLRKALPNGSRLVTDGQTIGWEAEPDSAVDVADFRNAVKQAAEAASRSDKASERKALEIAVALYEGDLLPESYDDWVRPLREELKQQLVSSLNRLTELLEQAGDYPAAIRTAERLVAEDPVRELSYRQLMRLWLLSGDRTAAVQVYHKALKVLRKELGISPAPETRALLDAAITSEGAAPTKEAPQPSTTVPPLVGRSHEWVNLGTAWAVVEQGQTLFVLVRGEAGIGKSRLAEELFSFAGRTGTAVRTRCYPAHGNLSYGPISDLLRTAPLRRGIEHLQNPQLTELARILPELLLEERQIAAPQPLAESWQRQHFFEALIAAFRTLRPVLLLVDDLQWCDRETLEWFQLLLHSSHGKGLLLLGTARSEEVDRDHPLLDLVRSARQSGQMVEVDLGPLAPEATEALARQITDSGLDQGYLARLHSETRGNPLFIIESVRSGVEDPEGRSSNTSLVNAVITSRLARLSPAAYEVAGLAAAVGRSFTFDLLQRSGDRDEDTLATALDELWRRRIIVSLEGQTYDFSHDRLREVAYEELSPIRRRHLHRRLARALSYLHTADPAAIAGQVAFHYEQAGLPREAIPNYSLAAQAARQVYADAEAAALLKRALQLCRDLPPDQGRERMELDLLTRLAAAQFSILGYASAEVGETNAQALRLARRLGEKRHILDALAGGWLFHIVRGRLVEARDQSSQFLAITSNDHPLAPTGQFIHGVCLFHLGDARAGRKHLESAMAAHREGGDTLLPVFFSRNIDVFSRSYLAHILWHQGSIREAFQTSDEATARAAHPFSLAIASTYAATLQLLASNAAEAERRADEAVEVCRKYDFSYYNAFASVIRASARARQAPDMAAVRELATALDAFRATGSELRLPFYCSLLAEAWLGLGAFPEVSASIETGLACESRNGETWCAALLRRIRGDLFRAMGQRDEARACYRAALDIATSQGARPFEAIAAASLEQLA